MKLKTAYSGNKLLKDCRMLTLRLQWCQLKAKETENLGEEILQMTREVFGTQTMVYVGTVNNRRTCNKILKRMPRANFFEFSYRLNAFTRTDEISAAQRKRCEYGLIANREYAVNPYKSRKHPLFPSTREEGVSLIQKMHGENITDYSAKILPAEGMLLLERLYCEKGKYRLEASISISAHAVDYDLTEPLAMFQTYLQKFAANHGLYAGYLFFEVRQRGAHEFYHMWPRGDIGGFDSGEYLLGYEWSAYLCNALAKQLDKQRIEMLQEMATVQQNENGLFYQMNCELPLFGLEEKRKLKKIFLPILKKGYFYFPAHHFYSECMQPAEEHVRLLRIKQEVSGMADPYFYMGYFHDYDIMKTVVPENYEIFDNVEIKD